MKILTNGCSFSHEGWPNFLGEDHTIKKLSYVAAGNKYISDSTLCELAVQKYDMVIIMWSGLSRCDEPVADITLFNDMLYKSKAGTEDYIFSGGIYGSWQNFSLTRLMFEGKHKLQDYKQLYHSSLLEIIKLQSYLKANKIKYYFMSYVNYWDTPKDWQTPIGDISLTNFPELEYLVKQIDFTPWIFYQGKNGYYEYAIENNLLSEDNWHPNSQAAQQWAEIIIKRIKEDVKSIQ
jgi:hypothetical protein